MKRSRVDSLQRLQLSGIKNMEKKIIGCFTGLTTLDYIYYVDSYPENNSKVKTGDYKYYVGGPAANAAITYALLGGRAVLLTCLGKSNIAGMIKGILEGYGVEVIDFSDTDELPNTATIVVDKNGNRTIFSGQSRVADIRENILNSEIRLKDGNVLFGETEGFCLFDLNQQEISLKILDKVSCPVVLDAGSWKENAERFLEKADVVISSEGFTNPRGDNIFAMKECSDALKAITRGENPILIADGNVPVNVRGKCVDSLGAGDIFHGAFCYAYFSGKMKFTEAIESAGYIAGESVKYRGPREWSNYIKKD